MPSRSGLLESGLSRCGGGFGVADPMSEDPAQYGNTADIERQLQRVAITLRQIADAVEHMPPRQLGDFVHLIAPAEELFKAAALVFRRPFGR